MSAGNKEEREQLNLNVKKSGEQFRVILKVLLALLAVIILTAAVVLIRGHLIEVCYYSVPAHSSGKVRIAALADLHGCMHGKNQERIVSRVKEADPDLIVYLGDMVERSRPAESVVSLVVLTERLVQIAPVYYVDGNHERDALDSEPEVYKELNAALADLGAVQLENETLRLSLNNGCIVNLCGITTHYYWEEEENRVANNLRKQEGINVLLCHYPESVIWYRAFEDGGLDLALWK